jgi:hypothetical protein
MSEWIKFESTDNKNYYYNTLNNTSYWGKTVRMSLPDNMALPHGWKIVESSTYPGKFYYYNDETKETQWNYPGRDGNQCSLRGLKWVGNSCYLDSVLQALFCNKSQFTTELLTEDLGNDTRVGLCNTDLDKSIRRRTRIQTELVKIEETIQGISTDPIHNVVHLRELFRRCPTRSADGENFWSTDLKDAIEVLGYLLYMFPVSDTAVTETITYGTNEINEEYGDIELSRESVVRDTNASVFRSIDAFTLRNMSPGVSLASLLEVVDDSGELDYDDNRDDRYKPDSGKVYLRRIQVQTIISTPILIIGINRVIEDESLIKKEVKVSHTIILGNVVYELQSIVVYRPIHYVCYFTCKGKWYLYNDTSDRRITRILDPTKGREVTTRGVIYVYVPRT